MPHLDAQIEQAIDMLATARRVVALTGAGISTPSGIPDYRSPKSGLWEKAEDMLEVATIYAFRRRPQAFYEWLRPLLSLIYDAQPNPGHLALAQLEACGRLEGLVTQNIDLLHDKAGSRAVYELHGHLREVVCLACHHVLPARPLLDDFLESGRLPRCRRCHHIMKPNVILFGELLPFAALRTAQTLARTCDVMLVVGSSLEVAPAGDLPALAKEHGARLILVNYRETHMDDAADLVIRADVAEVLPRIADAFATDTPIAPTVDAQYNPTEPGKNSAR